MAVSRMFTLEKQQDKDTCKHNEKKENVCLRFSAYLSACSHWDSPALVLVLVCVVIAQFHNVKNSKAFWSRWRCKRCLSYLYCKARSRGCSPQTTVRVCEIKWVIHFTWSVSIGAYICLISLKRGKMLCLVWNGHRFLTIGQKWGKENSIFGSGMG